MIALSPPSPSEQRNQLALAIGAFIVCFAIFGSVAAMMPALAERLKLSEIQVGMALAAPVLLGSIGRIPVGIFADRFGGKFVYLTVMSIGLAPAVILPLVRQYWLVLSCACLTGVTLSLFPVGVAFIASWYQSERQGRALGLLTMGSLGHSLPMFAAPLVVARLGYVWGFWTFVIAALAWMIVFAIFAREAPHRRHQPALHTFLRPLRQRLSWVFSAFYFLTLGCFLSLGSFLPHLLTGTFALSKTDAGFRAAGFVAATTLARPFGGILADRIGGRRVLLMIFPFIALAAFFLATTSMPAFTIAVLSTAIACGLGSGALFKLVPGHAPQAVGSVTGLVGAIGGLGGFFPPIALGLCHNLTGGFTPAFVCLALFALACYVVCIRLVPPDPDQVAWLRRFGSNAQRSRALSHQGMP